MYKSREELTNSPIKLERDFSKAWWGVPSVENRVTQETYYALEKVIAWQGWSESTATQQRAALKLFGKLHLGITEKLTLRRELK